MSEKKPKLTEADLAQRVVRFFEDQHWEAFQEVQCYQGSNRADIVVRQGKILVVIDKGKVAGVKIDRGDGKLRLVLATPEPVDNATE